MIHTRIDQLIDDFEKLNAELTETIQNCDETAWQTIVPDEERPACVMFHHIVAAYPFALGVALEMTQKQTYPPVTMEQIHQINADHADNYASVTKEDVLRLQTDNVSRAVTQLRLIRDEQLDLEGPLEMLNGRVLKLNDVLNYLLVGHGREHLAAVQTALKQA